MKFITLSLLSVFLLCACENEPTQEVKKKAEETQTAYEAPDTTVVPEEPEAKSFQSPPKEIEQNCYACHAIDQKIIGASFYEISKRHLTKKQMYDFLRKPEKFNDTAQIKHPEFNYFNDNDLHNIYSWIDTIRFLR